jgi:hypothetical protein
VLLEILQERAVSSRHGRNPRGVKRKMSNFPLRLRHAAACHLSISVMTNAQGGLSFAREVMRAIAVAYDWPDWQPRVRTEVKVMPAILARYLGTYQSAPNFRITFTLEGDQLMGQATNQSKLPVFPES